MSIFLNYKKKAIFYIGPIWMQRLFQPHMPDRWVVMWILQKKLYLKKASNFAIRKNRKYILRVNRLKSLKEKPYRMKKRI